MTLDEQVSLLAGGNFWETVAIDRLGIPSIKVTDGPNGARGAGSFSAGVKAASFPVGISLASSWDIGTDSAKSQQRSPRKRAPRAVAWCWRRLSTFIARR